MDTKLISLRCEPSPQFSQTLRARLRTSPSVLASPRRWSLRVIAVPALAAAILVVILSQPGARASAAALLARFRIINVVAVRIDPARFQTLGRSQLDLGALIGNHVDVLEDGGPPILVDSISEAGVRAGLHVGVPTWLPEGTALAGVSVEAEHATRVTADTSHLQQTLDALGISDVPIPDRLDGQEITIRVPPIVMLRYEQNGRWTEISQARSPEVTFSADVDLSALGEIGLRLIGATAEEARELARTIDWTDTLLIPLPPMVRELHRVDIHGNRGLAFFIAPSNGDARTMMLWSTGSRVFGILSTQELNQTVAVADSIP